MIHLTEHHEGRRRLSRAGLWAVIAALGVAVLLLAVRDCRGTRAARRSAEQVERGEQRARQWREEERQRQADEQRRAEAEAEARRREAEARAARVASLHDEADYIEAKYSDCRQRYAEAQQFHLLRTRSQKRQELADLRAELDGYAARLIAIDAELAALGALPHHSPRQQP